jgi:hypothetical protein
MLVDLVQPINKNAIWVTLDQIAREFARVCNQSKKLGIAVSLKHDELSVNREYNKYNLIRNCSTYLMLV